MKEMAQVIPVGSVVRVLSHRHPDVTPTTLGICAGDYEGGWVVKITGLWQIAGHDRGGTEHGTRWVWYPPEEVVVCPVPVGN